jgi:MYXO-CTERM domain-containing protein
MRALLACLAVLAAVSSADAGVTILATTSPTGGQYAPSNVVAVWVEDANGTFVKTIQRWGNIRKQYLVAWNQKAGTTDSDAITGASRSSHNDVLAIRWNLLGRSGAIVPDGTYTIRMELADSNAGGAGQNNQATFTFVKGANPQLQQNLASGGFTGVSIDFRPVVCNNGRLEDDEACDPSVAGSCPTFCEATSTDACFVDFLVGSEATCTAECTLRPVLACLDNDGCCPDDCVAANDSDCGPGGGSDGGDDEPGAGKGGLQGGCAAANEGSGWLLLAGLGFVVLVRRRT